MVDLQDGEVGVLVAADDGALVLAVEEADLQIGRLLDHVVVGEEEAVGVVHEGRAQALGHHATTAAAGSALDPGLDGGHGWIGAAGQRGEGDGHALAVDDGRRRDPEVGGAGAVMTGSAPGGRPALGAGRARAPRGLPAADEEEQQPHPTALGARLIVTIPSRPR